MAIVACGDDEPTNPAVPPGADGGADASPANDAAPSGTDAAADVAAPTDAGTDAKADADAEAGAHLVEKVIGATGGTVTTSQGVTIEVPAGAVAGDVTITVDEVTSSSVPPGATSVGPIVQLGPEGQVFSQPVKVTLPWSAPTSVPVVLAHSAKGGASWAPLTEGAGSDATHVWAYTNGFSWFQPIFYQGAVGATVTLDTNNAVFPGALAIGTSPVVTLRGTNFRTDTVVTLKRAELAPVVVPMKLTELGAQLTVPANLTATLGNLEIEVKNPQAAEGATVTVPVIEVPVLASLTPTTISVSEPQDGVYEMSPTNVTITSSKHPQNLSLCRVEVAFDVGGGAAAGAMVADNLAGTQDTVMFTVTGIQVLGQHTVRLVCGNAQSNALTLDFIVPK